MQRSNFDFDQISDWQTFEDLVAEYFRALMTENIITNLVNVEVQQSGSGSDGGKDILVTFEFDDTVKRFKRKWVVQCKFYSETVSKKHLATINIPSLIHEYNAVGYLLVVKNKVHNQLTESFSQLNQNCKFGYQYEIWESNLFKRKLLMLTNQTVVTSFFDS